MPDAEIEPGPPDRDSVNMATWTTRALELLGENGQVYDHHEKVFTRANSPFPQAIGGRGLNLVREAETGR